MMLSLSSLLCIVSSSILLLTEAASSKNPKRGIGYAGSVPGDVINANQTDSVISWLYNWDSLPPDYLATSSLKYIPMQWGSVGIDSFSDDVQIQGSDTILTFNEPDYINEANMLPVDAANLWMTYIQPLKSKGVRLGGPAVTASNTGGPWLTAFLQACTNCTVDFLPLHWYGSGVEGFYGYIWSIHSQYPQYPIWITEYAETSPNNSVVLDFLNQTTVYLDSLDWIERYSWFGYFRPQPNVSYNLLSDDGGLNNLGELYVGAKTVHTQVISSPTNTYQTFNGADNPTQGPATTWTSLPNSGSSLQRPTYVVQRLTTALASCFFAALWTFFLI